MSIEKLISAAVAERGEAMPSALRLRMESCFDTDFSQVRLHFSSASREANRALGSLAFAVADHICFGYDSWNSASFRYLLAHELAHVAQKRRGWLASRRVSEDQLEKEACAGAMAALCGRPAPFLSPDACVGPRLYGPAGHFYTSFWASLAAGFDLQAAKRIAFYTQMPDQVKELDATAAGLSMAASAGTMASSFIPSGPDEDGDSIAAKTAANRQASQNMMMQTIVQEGLHALTGKAAEVETSFRAGKLKDVLDQHKCGEPILLRIGLAVHAYGDSFAHRDIRTGTFMYSPGAGHAVELLGPNDPHSPDNLNLRQDLYCRYGQSLYGLLKDGAAAKVNVGEDDFVSQLKAVAQETTERAQADHIIVNIRNILYSTGVGITPKTFDDFDPVSEDREFTKQLSADIPPPWDRFKVIFQELNLPPDTLQNALGIAGEWAHSALTSEMIQQQANQALQNLGDDAAYNAAHYDTSREPLGY